MYFCCCYCPTESCNSGARDDVYPLLLVAGHWRERKLQLVLLQRGCSHGDRERRDDHSERRGRRRGLCSRSTQLAALRPDEGESTWII